MVPLPDPFPSRRARAALACTLALVAWGCKDFEPPPSTGVAPAAGAPPTAGTTATPLDDASERVDSPAPDVEDPAPADPVPDHPLAHARATRNHIVVPVPRERAVAVIDPRDGSSHHVPCGDRPWLIAASPKADLAVVLDASADRACVLHLDGDADESTSVDVVPDANAIALAPGPDYAVVFHDAALDDADDVLATQQVTVIALAEGNVQAGNVSVGLLPSEVTFSHNIHEALVATRGGVARVELTQASRGERAVAPALELDAAPELLAARLRLSPDGRRALAFEVDAATLYVLDFAGAGTVGRVDLAKWARTRGGGQDADSVVQPRIADASIAADGSAAWIALRGEQTVLHAPLPEALTDVTAIEPVELPGQPTDRIVGLGDGDLSLVFGERADDGRAALLPADPDASSLRLRLAARPDTIRRDGNGDLLALVHSAGEAGLVGYTAVRSDDGASVFVQTGEAPIDVAVSTDAGVLAVAVAASKDDNAELHVIDAASLATERLELSGAPLAVGISARAGVAFVQERHPDGRLTLYDLESGELRTLTGFAIAARVGEESP